MYIRQTSYNLRLLLCSCSGRPMHHSSSHSTFWNFSSLRCINRKISLTIVRIVLYDILSHTLTQFCICLAFVINHSLHYTLAFLASVAEYWLGYLLFGSSKRYVYIIFLGLALMIGGQVSVKGILMLLITHIYYYYSWVQFMRTLAMYTCAKNFAHLIMDNKDDHQLVTEGIYRYMNVLCVSLLEIVLSGLNSFVPVQLLRSSVVCWVVLLEYWNTTGFMQPHMCSALCLCFMVFLP